MQCGLPLGHELVVDNFAGGGGASTGIARALGRAVDIAINHDPEAVAMHRANHPHTRHFCESVFAVDPVSITRNQPVGLAWFSPDCTHHSKAKGKKPRSNKRRGLAWIVIRWARRVRPRVIMLENVEEFADWGPLRPDGTPCEKRKGQTFRQWVAQIERYGYRVEWRELRACDYGAPTIRKRLFLVARRDGLPIVWTAPTHGGDRLPYRTAAECIDWSIPCPSIFERKKPLRDATCRRIAAGVMRYVVNNPAPFVVTLTHHVAPALIQTGYGERKGQAPRALDLNKPLGTVVAGGAKHALVAAFLAKHYTGVVGSDARQPIGTVTATDHHSLVTSHLVKLYGTCKDGAPVTAPMPTVTASGSHIGEVRAFLVKYYGQGGQMQDVREPLHTIPTRDRFGLVMVDGEPHQIVDIGMRMLQPRELARGQGFSDEYIIDLEHNGKPLTKTAQTRMIGNSVCPDMAEALVRANFAHEAAFAEVAA